MLFVSTTDNFLDTFPDEDALANALLRVEYEIIPRVKRLDRELGGAVPVRASRALVASLIGQAHARGVPQEVVHEGVATIYELHDEALLHGMSLSADPLRAYIRKRVACAVRRTLGLTLVFVAGFLYSCTNPPSFDANGDGYVDMKDVALLLERVKPW